MENQTTPCKALVLAGGGARGSYQVGVWKALMELDWHPQIITGTSVGSLNGAMFVLDLYEVARDMWLTIRSKDVMELPEENADLSALHSFLRSVVKAGGMDVSPLEEIVERVLDEDALRRANIRFGLVTVEQRGLKPRELTLDEIPQGRVKDYLMASAACWHCCSSAARAAALPCSAALAAASQAAFSRASHSAMIFCFCSSSAASRAVRSSLAFSLTFRWAASISKIACIRSFTSFMQCTSLFESFT